MCASCDAWVAARATGKVPRVRTTYRSMGKQIRESGFGARALRDLPAKGVSF